MSLWQRAAIRAGLAFGAASRPSLASEGQVMDPMMAALVRAARGFAAAAGEPRHIDGAALAALRLQYSKGPPLVGLRPDHRVRTEPALVGGVPARRYRPPGQARGTLMFLHGGGFIMGDLDTHDGLCRAIALDAGVSVVAVQYRLAPEHPYPAAVEDALAAWDWVRARETGPVAVGGDSAGGNLAAVVAAERRGAAGPALQALLYPVVDMVGSYPSVTRFATGYLLTEVGLLACADLYMPPGVDRAQPRLSPLRAVHDGAAPAVVAAAGFDPLRDQGPAYAEALRGAGVDVALWCEEQLVHGFADFAGVVPAARRAVRRWAEAVGRGMEGRR